MTASPGSAPIGSTPSSPRSVCSEPAEVVARVLPDVAGLDKTFDYLIPAALAPRVQVGSLVRVELHGRRVGGWVLELGVTPPEGVTLRPVRKVTGLGPTPDLIELAGWAAWRWVGRRGHFLQTASPPRAVLSLPGSAPTPQPFLSHDTPSAGDPGDQNRSEGAMAASARRALTRSSAVLRVPPTADRTEIALAAVERGNALLLAPTVADASRLAERLSRLGVPVAVAPDDWARAAAGATTVGTRSAAWTPVADLAAIVVFDEHDEAYESQAAPTWHAREVALERARRAGVPCLLVSAVPSVMALAAATLVELPRAEERAGWPVVEIVDRRADDPVRGGLFSEALLVHLRRDQRIVCVLNRTGRSRLLACARCGDLARCERCNAAVGMDEATMLVCRRCGQARPVVCNACGGEVMKNLRMGVTRAREELEILVAEPVDEVTATSRDEATSRVIIGTEAVLHRVRSADVVVFLDIDQELYAPTYRAAEHTMGLVARAARLVRGRRHQQAGRLLFQTRNPDHEVLVAARMADPAPVAAAEMRRRRLLGFPPVKALARISGPAAGAFLQRLGHPLGVEVIGPRDDAWLVRSDELKTLCDALGAVERPEGRLRIDIDPSR